MATKTNKGGSGPKVVPINERSIDPDMIVRIKGALADDLCTGAYPHNWQFQRQWSDMRLVGKKHFMLVMDQFFCTHCLTRVTLELFRKDMQEVSDNLLRELKYDGKPQ